MLSQFLINSSKKVIIPSIRNLALTTTKLHRYGRESLRGRLDKLKYEKKPVHNFFNQSQNIVHHDLIPIRPLSHLYKALGFAAFVTFSSFTIGAIIHYERTKERLRVIITDMEVFFQKMSAHPSRLEDITQIKLSLAQKVVVSIIGINILVTLLWKIPKLVPFMTTHFTNSFSQKYLCLPMLTSIFSHQSAVHLFFNMYVLWSFAPVAMHKYSGVEQFCALYAASGVISSFFSLAHKAVIRSPVRALGASGAILGILTYTCMKMPDARLQIIFVPFFDFSAQSAVYGIILFDLIGLLGPWRKIFDHAAHLGGSLFGVWYAMYGENFIRNWYNPKVINMYRDIKGSM
uniref:rhomboid protease n=1 Tax=Parastrongyloides trichosuri TaxID=131310 RepID=A0A0N5A2P7_PARTI